MSPLFHRVRWVGGGLGLFRFPQQMTVAVNSQVFVQATAEVGVVLVFSE